MMCRGGVVLIEGRKEKGAGRRKGGVGGTKHRSVRNGVDDERVHKEGVGKCGVCGGRRGTGGEDPKVGGRALKKIRFGGGGKEGSGRGRIRIESREQRKGETREPRKLGWSRHDR